MAIRLHVENSALLRQAIDDRTHVALQGMHYLFVLDERAG